MKHARQVLILLIAALMTACASSRVKTETTESARVAAPVPAPAREVPRKEIVKKEVVKKEPVAEEAGDSGKLAVGSKFAKLKVGMTLGQVTKLIGAPNRQWQHATEKASKPFYFGPDRWVIQCAYKGEGVLTFNKGGEQLLTLIQVNRAE